ncbi:hypothetical protein PFAS1_05375 [Pseudomonas frederiksbergensis]|nr:hypothetical protein PFAS1_05375 [Pseudomonas frederiksbergensis]
MANILLREGVEGAASAQNCDIMQIFRIICKGLYLEIFLIQAGDVVDQENAASFHSTAATE